MKAVLQPEQFIDDYLYPIWEWFTDMFFDFQEVFKVNRISQYIFYMIWIEAIILPFAFWLVMSFILSYRNKRVTFLGSSYFKNIHTNLTPVRYGGFTNKFTGTFTGSVRSVGSHNRYLGTFNNSVSGTKVTGTKYTGTLKNNVSSTKFNRSLMPYNIYSNKFSRYSGLQTYDLHWDNIGLLKKSFSAVGHTERDK